MVQRKSVKESKAKSVRKIDSGAKPKSVVENQSRMADSDYRELFDASDDALFVHEIGSGRILDANHRTCELFGYTRDEILTLSVADISSGKPPYDQEHAANYINAAADNGPQCFEWFSKKKGGVLFWGEVTLKQVSLGGKQRVLAAVRDISDKKKAQEHAKLLASLVEQSSEGVALLDLEGEVLYLNKAFAAMHGYDPAELVGKDISIFHNDEQMEFVQQANEIIKSTGRFSGEVWHARRDGTLFPTLMHNSILVDENGNPTGMIGSALDITERVEAAEALKRSEERYRSLVDLSPDAIVVHQDGKIAYLNRAGKHLFHIDSLEEVIGRPLMDFVHPDYHGVVRRRVAKTYEGDWVGERLEEKMLCADGHELDVEVAVGPITYRGKHAAQVVIRDITERKIAEEKLRAYSENLERMVEERTHELDGAHAKLFHTSKLTAVGRMGASLAHQLNSPICGGLLFVDALLNDFENTEKQIRTLEILKKSLIGMRDVVDCTLSMAMVSRDGRPASDYVDMNESLNRVLDMSSLECKRYSIRVMKSLDPDLPKIPAVVGELDQVFINIIHNGIDAMPDGGDFLISSERVREGIVISIGDTGRGMPHEQISQIFEPFFTTRMAERGIGLGLAIALDIVQKYGGEIDAESKMGKGTTFIIRLPLKCDLDVFSDEDSNSQ
jgi:two-component system, sporulation sensor kinase A